jgi:3-deoxy-D-manno-octulosonic-acid transferase
MLILSKHDAWPNQIKIAKVLSIPIYMINASLGEHSKRIRGLGYTILKFVYPMIDIIYTISENDSRLFEEYFSSCNIRSAGDTKFDQVLLRKKSAIGKEIIPNNWLDNSFVIVTGSIWKDDFEVLMPVLQKSLEKNLLMKYIFVPHDPSENFIKSIISAFPPNDCILYSEISSLKNERIIIINKIGLLADLYKYAKIAIVGGGYKQGIHNVMEPAIYGIPVIYGPMIQNSSEAVRLSEFGGGFVVSGTENFGQVFYKLIDDNTFRIESGEKAARFTLENTGATERLTADWEHLLR